MTEFTHLDATGAAHMVDVSQRDVTERASTARIAGILGAKRTSELIPLCHPIAITYADVALAVEDWGVAISADVRIKDRTGVEMEALTAVSVAGLTIIDMVKSVDPAAVLTDISVATKSGGRSGEWRNPNG